MITEILPANSVTGGYEVSNSLRFNSGSSDALSITPGSASNRKTFTISYWVKRAKLGAEQAVCGVHENSSHNFAAFFNGDDQIEMKFKIGGANNKLQTNAKFKDTSAWYHIVLAVDTTDGTAANRFKLYVNGVQVSSFDTATYPNADVNTEVNLDGLSFKVGRSGNDDDTDHLDGYLAEFCLIDGLQLAPTSFGEFDEDSNIWKPINVSGLTFGTNGLYLEFKGSGTSANSSGMGADTSGNDNHLTVNNLTAIDQSLDTCTNNHCTQNPIDTDANVVLSEGNLKVSNANNSYYSSCGTLAPVKGRWYFEAKVVSLGVFNVGITKATQDGTVHAQVDAGRVAYSSNGNLYDDSGDPLSDTSTTFGANDIIGVFLDLESGTQAVHFQKNGADVVSRNLADSYSGYTGGFKAAFGMGENDTTSGLINFGAPPFAISSSNSDANGYGDFEYSPVRSSLNYYTLNTKNLAEFG